MNSNLHSNHGAGLVTVIIATVLLGVTTVGVIQYANSVGQHRRELDTKVQEDSYRVFQSELALSGANPNGMAANPLLAASTSTSPDPTIALVGTAGRTQAGSADVSAYSASSDADGRSGSLGFRIASSGTAEALPVTTPLLPPTFRLSGTVPESEFSPNLTNLILGNAGNPPGTVYRFTVDGSDPTAASPIWNAGSSIPAYPLPSIVKAAAFIVDPSYTNSSVVTTALSRSLEINYARSSGGTATSFTYAEVSGATNGIILSITNAPADTMVFYSYDGSTPTIASTPYLGSFHVPLENWSANVTLQAIAISAEPNVTFSPFATTLTPIAVALPPPTFGTQTGSTTVALIPVSSVVDVALIRYDIDQEVAETSPTIASGSAINVTAP